jgi:squalene-hopene/tetraprenyl-beta-curcumene cyclase
MTRTRLLVLLAGFLASATVQAADAPLPAAVAKPTPNSADEPLAKEVSFAKTATFLDGVGVGWTRDRKCGTCHTNYPYLLARPLLSDGPAAGVTEVRKFFENRAANWDRAKPRWDTEVVATASFLALHDAESTGKLHPITKQALDRMWTLQQKDGAWNWLKCNWPPLEHDDYYGATLAALAVGRAPDNYAQGDSAKEGLTRLRGYFEKTAAPDLHHKLWLLWAAQKLDGLMDKPACEATIKELLALQRADGGWSLPSLGDWRGFDGRANDKKAPSDGYATGLAVYVLRQAGVPANDQAVQRGVTWLKTNQRESGRWFTRSLNTDAAHYMANAGTCFAVMALKACE